MSKFEFLKQDIDIVESLPSLYPSMQEHEEEAVINVVKALREKEFSEQTNMNELTTKMMEHICDNICKHPIRVGQTQDELDDICAECKMGQFVCDILNAYNRLNDFDKTQSCDLLKKLSVYRNLEEQGLLLTLPCKVGDKLHTIILGRIEVYEVSGFLTDRHGVMLRLETKGIVKSRFIESEQIGKTVFLTEQDAQAALEKMKGE